MNDPFGDFLSRDNPTTRAGSDSWGGGAPVESYREVHQVTAPPIAADLNDPNDILRAMLASAQRQEQYLEKICQVMTGMDWKIEQLNRTQERLEATMQRGGFAGPSTTAGASGGIGLGDRGGGTSGAQASPPAQSTGPVNRGQMIMPPGMAPRAQPPAQANPANNKQTMAQAAGMPEDPRLAHERLEAERLRIAEEGRRRAEEIQQKREFEERQRREEEERQRLEEERLKNEERQRKAALENKTNALMSNLLTSGGGGGGLFGDDEPAVTTKKGGLFDD